MNSQIKSGVVWKTLERFGAQGVTFVVSIILARLLDPKDHGTIAVVTVLLTILQVFVDSGLGNALIQKKDADEIDFSTVFFYNLLICVLLYVLLFFFAPIISNIYNDAKLTSIIRVLGLVLIISGFKNIQNAYVARKLLFREYFYATLSGTVTAAIIGIWMAYNGFGVWALVFQNLINQFIDTVILGIIIKWKPKKIFSFERFKILFNYGWKLLASSLLDTTWNQLRQLIIGKKYTSLDLAYYNKGQLYPNTAACAIIDSVGTVLFPVLSKEQNNVESVKEITKKTIKIESYILWPMLLGIAACSNNLVIVLLTDKWSQAIPFLIIFCINYVFYPIHTVNLNAIKAIGRSDIFLKLEILKKFFDLLLIIISIRYGVYAMAISCLISNVISQIINTYPNKKLINYSYFEQIKDICLTAFASIAMAAIVYSINYIGMNIYVTLFIQVLVGIITYILFSIILKNDCFYWCLDTIKNIINSH